MSSRPLPTSGELRHSPRDRSPTRFITDRRPSSTYSGPISARLTENNYRPNESNVYFSREPPKGPKAHFDGPRGGGFPPRGRGFAGRIEQWDREARDPPFQRRDAERDWPRRDTFESRDRRPSPPGRNRSRSPVSRDFRNPPPRDLDLARLRRDSHNGPSSASSSIPEAPQSAGFSGRGSSRGRGRGDLDYRGRGRGLIADDRESFRVRSHSQERSNARGLRDDRARERDWETASRRDGDEKHIREDLENGPVRVNADTYRPNSRNSNGSLTRPSTPHSGGLQSSYQNGLERHISNNPVSSLDMPRRPPNTPGTDQFSREETRKNPSMLRKDSTLNTYGSRTPSSPPQAPQVPAFGSVPNRPINLLATPQIPPGNAQPTRMEVMPQVSSKAIKPDPRELAPTAPKALIPHLPPSTAPRGKILERTPQNYIASTPTQAHNQNQDIRNPTQINSSMLGIPSAPRFNNTQRVGAPNRFQPLGSAAQLIQNTEQRPPGYSQPRLGQQEASLNAVKPPVRPQARSDPVGITGKTPPRAPMRLMSAQAPFEDSQTGLRNWQFPHKTWINPNNLKINSKPNQQPSIMNTLPPTITQTVPAKRDYTGESRGSGAHLEQSTQSTDHQSLSQALNSPKSNKIQIHKEPADREANLKVSKVAHDSGKSLPQASESPSARLANPNLGNLQGGQTAEALKPEIVSDDEEAMDLDEGDLLEADKKFHQEMQALDTQRPVPPRNHPDLVPLLKELEALASAAEDLAKGLAPEPAESVRLKESFYVRPKMGLPSPKSEGHVNEELEFEEKKALQNLTDDEDENLPLDGLPFLISGPPTPFSEIGLLQASPKHHEHVKSGIIAYIRGQKEAVVSKWEDSRVEYAQLYKSWRQRIDEIDRQKKALAEVAYISASPAPATSPIITPSALSEVSRPRLFASELDMQRVLEESKIAAEAEAVREKEAQESQALADMEKEAVIPDMLCSFDTGCSMYEDTNHMIDSGKALEVLEFVPPPDDFTPEEHNSFTDLFMVHPKKWGTIAAAIPGRDYQDCIQHYYLSKKEANYKVQLNKKMTKKGRKVGRGPQARLKPNALMSDMGGRPHLYENSHYDLPLPLAVTETGRPKRTAAPTFGNSASEGDPGATNLTPRRGAGIAKGDVSGDQTAERPVARRTRTAQPKEKGAKRGGKTAQTHQAILPAAPGSSPQKKNVETVKDTSKELKFEDEQHTRNIEEAQLPTNLQKSQIVSAPISQPNYTEDWPNKQSTSLNGILSIAPISQPPPPPPAAPPPPPQLQPPQSQLYQQPSQRTSQEHSIPHRQASSQPQQPKGSTAQTTSSYWSVPEVTLFKDLLAHFGTDWQQIANHLKTKTPVMVKNHYYRSADKGDSELEVIAKEADEKIKNGVQMGSAPQPSLSSKRRHESIPQTTQQRPLAPNPEVLDGDESPALLSNPIAQHSTHMNQIPPKLAPLPQADGGSPISASQSASQKSGTPINRNPPLNQQQQSRGPRQPQGPPTGYFSERAERAERENRPISQVQTLPQRQQPPQLQEAPVQQPQQRPASEMFQEELTRQHRKRQEQEPQIVHIPQSSPPQVQTISRPQMNETRSHPQSRIVPSIPTESDQRPLFNGHQPGSMNPSPPSMRRLDSFGSTSHGELPFQSTTNSRTILSPPQESIRASSVPMSISSQLPPPSRPAQPKEAKRSNIMSILNDEPAEPQPRKSLNEPRLRAPTPPLQQPSLSNPAFPQPSQLAQHIYRHDKALETKQGHPQHHHVQQQQASLQAQQRIPLNQLSQHAQQQQQQQQQPQSQQDQRHQEQVLQPRDPSNSWSTVAQRIPRQSFTQAASSPRQQHMYTQPSSRQNLQHIQPTRAPSPPPPPPSVRPKPVTYSSLHAQQSQPQQPILQATPSLSASPYASMTQQPSQLQPHPQRQQPPPPQRPQSSFQIPIHNETVLRQQHEATLRREEALHQQSIIRQQEFVNRHEYPRPKDPMIQQQIYQQQQQQQQQEREREREREREYRSSEQLRRDDLRRPYTPPPPPQMYHAGYGGHPPPQQQSGRGGPARM